MSDSIIPPDATVHELRVEQISQQLGPYPFVGLYKTLDAMTVNRDDWVRVLVKKSDHEWVHLIDLSVRSLFAKIDADVPVWIGAGAQISFSVSKE